MQIIIFFQLLHRCPIKCRVSRQNSGAEEIDVKVEEMRFSLSPCILKTIVKIYDNLIDSVSCILKVLFTYRLILV